MILLFGILLFSVIYCYFGYPLVIYVLARLKPNPVIKQSIEPTVSIVISLYNEEDVILNKLNNFLELDYPKEKMEIIIGSDGSTDKTNVIVGQFHDSRIKLVVNSNRQGKMATLNSLIPQAKHEIIIFTDARQAFAKNVIKVLVSNFADPKIGCVSGELVFKPKEGSTAQGVGLYWTYEKFIRDQESRVHSMLGATGAIYAIRKKLFVPGPADVVLDDMYTPFRIIQQGYRAIFDKDAYAYDFAAAHAKEEYRRKARTLYGNYQIFALFPGMFNPFKSPIAFQLFSHKFLRVIVPFFLIAMLVINFILRYEPVFNILWFLQIVFYAMAIIGQMVHHEPKGVLKIISKVCYIPYVFCLLNFSALVGFWRFICSKPQNTWQKARGH
jgi:biofilm PGA synthesis N-glycosyltransferase PgaC